MVARAQYASVRNFCDTHFGGLFAATTSSPAALRMRTTDFLVVLHLGAAFGFATASWFTTACIRNTTCRFTTAGSIATSVTAIAVAKTKAKALCTEGERKNDRPENDVPFHLFRLLQ
jgi:hypothetical protein